MPTRPLLEQPIPKLGELVMEREREISNSGMLIPPLGGDWLNIGTGVSDGR